MAAPATFYLEQAEKCSRSAEASTLDRQREIFLRSRAAWLLLAEREQEVQAGRAERDKARLEDPYDG
jgi:hypothetical protein